MQPHCTCSRRSQQQRAAACMAVIHSCVPSDRAGASQDKGKLDCRTYMPLILTPQEHSLPNISPRLARASHLQLAMPGTYRAHQPIVSIESFGEVVRVILSKQRPRRIAVRGSDGLDHTFLLKGNEDLRQDERVMQVPPQPRIRVRVRARLGL